MANAIEAAENKQSFSSNKVTLGIIGKKLTGCKACGQLWFVAGAELEPGNRSNKEEMSKSTLINHLARFDYFQNHIPGCPSHGIQRPEWLFPHH